VLLLGKDGSCASRPAELAAVGHAATLEYRQGRYTVYNRLPQPVQVGAHSVPVRGSREWRSGERLRLGEAVVLRLEVDGDPAPVRAAPKAGVGPDVPDAPAAPPAAKKGKNRGLAFVLIAACLALGVGSFFVDREETPTEASAPAVDFNKLIEELRRQ